MKKSIHILGFAGSLRQASYNAAALRATEELLPRGVSFEIFNLACIPLYNSDLETASVPKPVQQFRNRIMAADGLLIATPEYNHSISGVLKNALDWASRPYPNSCLNGKPVAIMGATTGSSGTLNAQVHLHQICKALKMHPLDKPKVLISRAATKFNPEGYLTDDPTCQQIQALLEALVVMILKL